MRYAGLIWMLILSTSCSAASGGSSVAETGSPSSDAGPDARGATTVDAREGDVAPDVRADDVLDGDAPAQCEALKVFRCDGCEPTLMASGEGDSFSHSLRLDGDWLYVLVNGREVHGLPREGGPLEHIYSAMAEPEAVRAFDWNGSLVSYVRKVDEDPGELIRVAVLRSSGEVQPTFGQPITVFDAIEGDWVMLSSAADVIAAGYPRVAGSPEIVVHDRHSGETFRHVTAQDRLIALFAHADQTYWVGSGETTSLSAWAPGGGEPVMLAQFPAVSRHAAMSETQVVALDVEGRLWWAPLDAPTEPTSFEPVLEEVGEVNVLATADGRVVWSDGENRLHAWHPDCERAEEVVPADDVIEDITVAHDAIYWRTDAAIFRFP